MRCSGYAGAVTTHDHLAALPLYWINCESAPERRREMEQHIAPLFATERRLESPEGFQSVSDADAMTFVRNWRSFWDVNRAMLTMANKPPGRDSPNLAVQKANVAIRSAHLAALAAGVSDGHPRFMVAEDDLMVRQTLCDVSSPPVDADVAIWSGGLALASVRSDDRSYAAGHAHRWLRVSDRACFNCLGAGMYEVTREAAITLRDIAGGIPMSWDHAWGAAFQQMTVYRMAPNALVQAGPSIRVNKIRTPVTVR